MNVPKAVREASERANKLHAEAYAEDETQNEETSKEGEDQQDPSKEPEEAPKPTSPQQPPATPPQQQPPREETIDYWRDKFRTLDGKYRAEVPRLQQDLRAATQQISNLETMLSKLNEQPSQNSTNPLVSPEEIEEYGEDFVSMMRRLAQEEAGRAVQRVAPRIQHVEGQLLQNQAQTAADRVFSLLDSNVQDWRTINRDPEFLEWLAEEDPFAGAQRAVMLREAFDKKDGHRVLTFFQAFLNQRRVVTQPPKQAQTPSGTRVQGKMDLHDLAGPRSSGGATPQPKGEEEIQPWTRRQIAAFYKDVQTGHYKSDPELQRKIEQSIHKATIAGLVRP